ncbi:DUF2336 domain-containing protein [Stappia sp. F7233]|uniref:DUF2336 domain-containing protein n=1 Tax=Stappia albiluteola TaxID=2758565 RepID=A0A839AFN7_9HYPH|nr:DUF2336 domain-containing protein [Stappia albiluteola]MBA5777848.1 DUF2336 domain-containing protein [Stappia albiluteola]
MSNALHTELVNFEALTESKDTARSNELARHVAMLFSLTSESCSDEQMDIYDSVLTRLSDMVEEEARCFIAERLCKLRRAPESTIRKLATDNIAVARPVLEHSTVLRDTDLEAIARSMTDDHRLAIAARVVLSEPVTDALVEEGSRPVKLKVAENEGAAFSDQGMSSLIDAAKGDEDLQIAIGSRGDLADSQILSLVEIASERVRARLIESDDTVGVSRLPQAARLAAQRMSNEFWIARYDFETASGRINTLARTEGLTEATLRRFAVEDRFPEVVSGFAFICDIGVEEAKHWMVRVDTDPFLIVAKANGFSTMTVQALLKIGPWRHRLSNDARIEAVARYEGMRMSTARKMLDQWQGRMAV